MLRRYHKPPDDDPDGTETESDAPQADKPAGRSRSQTKKKEE